MRNTSEAVTGRNVHSRFPFMLVADGSKIDF
nr:MAG TPA: hypothetical protein [Caudoviricetes sp.]